MRFQTKDRTVEAVQFLGYLHKGEPVFTASPKWLREMFDEEELFLTSYEDTQSLGYGKKGDSYYIIQINGWLVKGVDGINNYSNEIFQQLFEPRL